MAPLETARCSGSPVTGPCLRTTSCGWNQPVEAERQERATPPRETLFRPRLENAGSLSAGSGCFMELEDPAVIPPRT